ncbi:aryl hydrocarbon receptor-like [Spinachia spinachia]
MNNNMYSARKRRKAAQKGVKPVPAEGAKSNPSKRHRDRLNSELDRLASMLPFPEDVISSLDKLSILRLSVSFLRTKSFFSVTLKNRLSNGVKKSADDITASVGGAIPEGELLLQALNGFVLVVTAEGTVFFCSHTVQDYLGFHQTDVMHQSVLELIHTEDQQEFRSHLHWALHPATDPLADGESASSSSCLVSYAAEQLPPENSSFLERSFVCRFRCLLDNSSGFLALNIQGRLKFLRGQSRQRSESEAGAPPQLALFAIATPLQSPAILEIRTRNMIFRTKHKLDFTPMSCDAKGKIVLGYTEAELRVRGSGYQFIHAADMLYCAENHVRMMKTGESGLTVFRLLTKDNRWKWVQANARLVYKNSKPDYIIATQRPLVDEEGGEHLRKRSGHLPFTFATGEATLYQTAYPLHGFPDSNQGKARGHKSKKGKLDRKCSEDLDPKSLLGALMSQDGSVYVCRPDAGPEASYHGEQQSDGEAWRCSSKPPSYDPLLATLDSLSLDAEEPCSNSELFSALENLGLNAEDLELLLLDERMIQVELGSSQVPTLCDLLTNNEILSYIHDSLGSGVEAQGPAAQSVSQQPQAVRLAPPITQLSQQMLQHMSAEVKAPPVQLHSVSQPGTSDCGTPNTADGRSHCHPRTAPGGWPLESGHQWQPQQDQHSAHLQDLHLAHLQDQHPAHLQDLHPAHLQDQHPAHLQDLHPAHLQDLHPAHLQDQHPAHQQDLHPVHLQNQHLAHQQDLHLQNQHPAHLQDQHPVHLQDLHPAHQQDLHPVHLQDLHPAHLQDLHPDLHPAHQQDLHPAHQQDLHPAHQQDLHPAHLQDLHPVHLRSLRGQLVTNSPYIPNGHAVYSHHATPRPLQGPSHSSALETQQFLGASQPEHSLPSLEPPHSKLENSRLLGGTNAAYVRACLMPNGNAGAPSDLRDGLRE